MSDVSEKVADAIRLASFVVQSDIHRHRENVATAQRWLKAVPEDASDARNSAGTIVALAAAAEALRASENAFAAIKHIAEIAGVILENHRG